MLRTLALLAGCNNDVSIAKQAICDGVLQGSEETVDAPFDADEDGFFDASNDDCASVYAATNLDCDDGNPDHHPGAAEQSCDGVDNDCDEATADAEDVDGDGVDVCDDCDDNDADALGGGDEDADEDGFTGCEDCDDTRTTVNPEATESACNGLDDDCNEATADEDDVDGDGETSCTDCDDLDPYVLHGVDEVCDNEIDDNCDEQVDENCTIDYGGDWAVDERVRLSCAFGYVDIDFVEVEITDRNPEIRVYGEGTNAQPGTMEGEFSSDVDFEAENVISGSCDEVYSITGTFITENTFEATFTAAFIGGGACADCEDESWELTGTRL